MERQTVSRKDGRTKEMRCKNTNSPEKPYLNPAVFRPCQEKWEPLKGAEQCEAVECPGIYCPVFRFAKINLYFGESTHNVTNLHYECCWCIFDFI